MPDQALFDAAATLLLQRPTAELAAAAAVLFDFEPSEEEAGLARQDWSDLFFVPSSGRYLPPMESAFRQKRLGGPLAADAERAYRTAGFDPAALDLDPLWRSALHPDHLGVQLAFVSALLRGTARRPADAPGLAASAEFFHAAHLAPWAGDFGQALTGSARCRTYRHLGRLLEELAAWRPGG